MADETLRARGREVRRLLAGKAHADRLDRDVYTDRHMAKFGELTQEVLFAQLWTRPGLDMKTKTMVTLVSDVSTGAAEALGQHVRFARNHGWTEDEIVDVMLHLVGYIGVPLVRKSILVASEVFAAMQAEEAASSS